MFEGERNEGVGGILADLVRIPSETGQETAATEYLRRFLQGLGAEALFDDGVNLAAALDWGPGPALLFLAHHDTVPAGDPANWSHDPCGAEVEGDRLYGRGAVDDKGGLAAMLATARVLCREAPPLRGRLILASVREETSDLAERGILRLLEAGLRADFAVVGEPSGHNVALGHRGRYVLRLQARGRAAHASVPEKGVNAISHIAAVIQALDSMALPEHTVLGRGTQAVTRITGGVAQNVIPEAATIDVDRRPVVGETPESVVAGIEAALAPLRSRIPALEVFVDVLSTLHPSLVNEGEAIVQAGLRAIEAAGGTARPPGAMRDGHTDQEWLVNDAAIPTIILGPGSAANMHGPDEYVEISQVMQATEIYRRLALAVLSGGP